MASHPFLKPVSAVTRLTLGKYELLCRLSAGGMSEIFLATQKGIEGFRKVVVLKTILPDVKGEDDFVSMFLEEARITSAFNHPNIAQVFDLDTDAGTLFLAMEFVQGATFTEIIRAARYTREPLPIGFTLATMRDAALALHYAHTFTDPRGRKQLVIHRDVAGKNLMVTYEGITKLLDFGIAKALGGRAASTTSVGMVKGTSGYMSPEQVLGEPLDPRSDLFSLGVVLYEGLTGQRLFSRATAEEEMRAALDHAPPLPSIANPDVPPALDQLTLKALARKRENRFGSALEFARALEKAAPGVAWHPEQSGALVQKYYVERLTQTRELVKQAQGTTTGEHSGLHLEELITTPMRLPAGKRPTLEGLAPVKLSLAPLQPVSPMGDFETARSESNRPPTVSLRPPPVTPLATDEPPHPTDSEPIFTGVPAFRPLGEVHDTGPRPPREAKPLEDLFADLSTGGKQAPTDPAQLGGGDEPPTRIAYWPEGRGSSKRLLVGLGLMLVAIGGGLYLLFAPRPPAPVPEQPGPGPVQVSAGPDAGVEPAADAGEGPLGTVLVEVDAGEAAVDAGSEAVVVKPAEIIDAGAADAGEQVKAPGKRQKLKQKGPRPPKQKGTKK